MRSLTRYWIMLLGLIVLAGSFIACGGKGSGLATYTNDSLKYTISYPFHWQVKEIDASETNLIPPEPYRGYVSIRVLQNSTLPFEMAVQVWVSLMERQWESFSMLESWPMKDNWDWYLEYDFVTDDLYEFHGQSYFKQVAPRIYKVEIAGEKKGYDAYPFGAIVSSFKVLK